MPPSVTDHSARAAGRANMTSGSFFKVRPGWSEQGLTLFLQVREREELEVQEARQKASIKWLVCKAYSNKPPANIVDPYYKDHQDKDRLKPAVLHSLANAELYCMTMAALYQDPNYHNLNHWGIIQVRSLLLPPHPLNPAGHVEEGGVCQRALGLLADGDGAHPGLPAQDDGAHGGDRGHHDALCQGAGAG